MLRPTITVLTALLASGPTRARPQVLASLEEEQRALFERVAPSVVVVSDGSAISAGFLAAPGLVVTSAHGVLGARDAAVTFHDGRTVRGEVVASSPHGLDLALLRVPALPGERVLAPGGHAALRPGDVIVAVGHGDGNRWSFSTGMVSNPLADGPDGALARLQLPLRPGASGGPVVDRAGRLIGVVVHGDPSAVTFAIRTDAVLRAFPELAASAASTEPGPASAPEAIAIAREEPTSPPLRAPELIVAPPDPRPVPARAVPARTVRVAREVRGRATVARVAPVRHEPPAMRPVALRAEPDTGGLARELASATVVGAAGLLLAALVLGGALAASARRAVRAIAARKRTRRLHVEEPSAPWQPQLGSLRLARAPVRRGEPPPGR